MPSRSGNCHSKPFDNGPPTTPIRIASRSRTASSMVGYIDSSTTASTGGQSRHNTRDAAPSETPITPIRRPGASRRKASSAARTPCASRKPNVTAGAVLAP